MWRFALNSANAIGVWGYETIKWSGFKLQNRIGIGVSEEYTSYPSIGLSYGSDGIDEAFDISFLEQAFIFNHHYKTIRGYDTNSSQLAIGSVDTAKFTLPMLIYETLQPYIMRPYGFFNGRDEIKLVTSNTRTKIDWMDYVIRMPRDIMFNVGRLLKAEYRSSSPLLICDCSQRYSGVYLNFPFQGFNITVSAMDLITPSYNGNWEPSTLSNGSPSCNILILPLSKDEWDSYDIILGAPFCRNAYIWNDFRWGQIGIAAAVINATDINVIPVGEGGLSDKATVLTSISIKSITSTGTTRAPRATTTTSMATTSPANPSGDGGGDGGRGLGVGAVSGAAVGGVAGIAIIGVGLFIFIHRRKGLQQGHAGLPSAPVPPEPKTQSDPSTNHPAP
ncbi:hypothetical protein TWF730_009982 [Orbilia blumenaviensis]|uniref:Peptidase A1 domain-containing protein n=1 Tax=Orbilia blumenaviensis TaxID=1796055 RepID=A0AAV9UTC9_9PEZI